MATTELDCETCPELWAEDYGARRGSCADCVRPDDFWRWVKQYRRDHRIAAISVEEEGTAMMLARALGRTDGVYRVG